MVVNPEERTMETTTATVRWSPNDFSECGRFAIQTERVRGEGAYHELWLLTPEVREAAERLAIDLGSYGDKRVLRRRAQRIADALAKDDQS